jgi:alanine transaminase
MSAAADTTPSSIHDLFSDLSLSEKELAESRLSVRTMNDKLLSAEYAVRGELAILADELHAQLSSGDHSLPFDRLIYSNIGNPMALGQKPMTFNRQVMAAVNYPALLEEQGLFPADVVKRAKRILAGLAGGNIGAYSGSVGTMAFAKDIAKFLKERDGYDSDPATIIMTNGASDAISKVLTTIIRGPQDGILIPIPQYPLYSATIALLGGTQVPYSLDESKGWDMDMKSAKDNYLRAKKMGITPRALVIINPGNPTGQVLSRSNLEEIIHFCHRTGMMLLADEVYQTNIYTEKSFHSARSVLFSMGKEISSSVQLASFHSTSKGFLGECGYRGGFAEVLNFDPQVKGQLWKLSSIQLCCNLNGQVMMSLMVDPPRKGDESYDRYVQERDEQIASLKRRAERLNKLFNTELEGVTCNPAEGAMYLFPQIVLPPKAIQAAKEKKKQPDTLYCLELLQSTGICVVPGSGFLQKDGTYHFRTTFLPPENEIENFAAKIKTFHSSFLKKYQ